MAFGPADPSRALPAADLLPLARSAARTAGVTRLADVTRLDRLGFPVWQAVRPLSRALSVHQGKGATHDDARLGALLEAVESHHAEMFDAAGPVCAFEDLDPKTRPPRLGDVADGRTSPPEPGTQYRWVEATTPAGAPVHLPLDLVSLDFTRNVPSPFDRASNGVATGTTREEAVRVALQELIERDAVTEWASRGMLAVMADHLSLDSVPFAWFADLRARIENAGIHLGIYRVPSITGTPVFVCELNDRASGGAYGANEGRGCHPVPEIALFKAVAEAIQGRATFIAGAREDLVPESYEDLPGQLAIAFGFPPPPSMPRVEWDSIPPGPPSIIEALEHAGYGDMAIVELGRPEGFVVVRAFVFGLASFHRRRRPPVRPS